MGARAIIGGIVLVIMMPVAAYAEDPDVVASRFVRSKGGSHCQRTGSGDGSTLYQSRFTYSRHKSYDCLIRNERYSLELEASGINPKDPDDALRWTVKSFDKIEN